MQSNKPQAFVKWTGSLKKGDGSISSASGALLRTPYSFSTRFEGEDGTNPEELLAAAHAACFTMALAGRLAKDHWSVNTIDTTAAVKLEEEKEGQWHISKSHIEVAADVPKLTAEELDKIAQEVLKDCPVSKVLKAELSVNAQLRIVGEELMGEELEDESVVPNEQRLIH